MNDHPQDRIYFDYCATTPLHPDVLAAMLPALQQGFGNPSSLHADGRAAAELLAAARARVAACLGAEPDDIIFTSGATEADNLALAGILQALAPDARHLVTSSVEHHAVLHAAERLEQQGFEVSVLPVDATGRVDPQDLQDALRPDTGLISIMTVNNEVGSVQPIEALAEIARQHGVCFHTDAVQAVGTSAVALADLSADAISLSGHKIYGPKGTGALYLRAGTPLKPMLLGGPQEGTRRAGTENVAGALGFAAALERVTRQRAEIHNHLAGLRRRLVQGLEAELPQARVNGHPSEHAAHILSVTFPGVDAELLLYLLDQQGIAASMGSACNAESIEPSHVLLAMGLSREDIAATVRFSFGQPSTEPQIDRLLALLPETVKRARAD